MFDSNFESWKKETCISLKQIVTNFFGYLKDPNSELIIANMLNRF